MGYTASHDSTLPRIWGKTGPPKSSMSCIFTKGCTAHKYRESVAMGETQMNPQEAGHLIERLMNEWHGKDYDLLRKNCVIFSDKLCQGLGVGPVPAWVK